MSDNQARKVAFVTGANRGIGFETARELAKIGFAVVLGARDEKKAEAAAAALRSEGLDAIGLVSDATIAAHRQRTVEYFDERFGKLDVLVNNAGVWLETENSSVDVPNVTSSISEDIIRATFESNFFAPVLLTQKLLPLILKSQAGRIVNVSSLLGSNALHADSGSTIYNTKPLAYDASKAALNMFTNHLAHELKHLPVKVNSVHPGWVQTTMGGPLAPMSVSDGSASSVIYASLADDGPSGGFFHLHERIPW